MEVSLISRLQVRREQVRQATLVALSIVIGALGAVANVVFSDAIELASYLFWQLEGSWLGIDRGWPWNLWTPAILVSGGVFILALERVFPGEVLGYGFPRFLEMLHLAGGRVKRRWMVAKTLGAALSLGAGAAVGREGPVAQIGGSIAAAVARAARVTRDEAKALIACGTAAAIATTFNAPIAGMLFAQEIVLLGDMRLTNFSLIVVSSATGVVISRAAFGNAAAFEVGTFQLHSYRELMSYALLGVLLGLLAVAYTRLFYWTAGRFRALPGSSAVKLLAGLAVVGLIAVPLPQNLSDGYEVINQALGDELPWTLMLALAMAKFVASCLSLGCGAPGGVFGPCLFIGAMAGGSFQRLAEILLPDATGPHGSYALIGLGSFLAAVTHAPLTSVFLLFEMTQNIDVTVPALVTTGVAVIVARFLQEEGFDTYGLALEGKHLLAPRDVAALSQIPVDAVFRHDTRTVPASATGAEILRIVADSDQSTFPVVDADGRLIGAFSLRTVRLLALESGPEGLVRAADLCEPDIPVVTPHVTLAEALRRMEADGVEEVPVVDAADPSRLLGTLSRSDVVRAYNRATASLGMAHSVAAAPEVRRWEEMLRVATVPVPREWVGSTLRQIDCRARYGISVLAVRRADGVLAHRNGAPDPDRPLARGDTLVIAGPHNAVERVVAGAW